MDWGVFRSRGCLVSGRSGCAFEALELDYSDFALVFNLELLVLDFPPVPAWPPCRDPFPLPFLISGPWDMAVPIELPPGEVSERLLLCCEAWLPCFR